ncbi:MAG: ArnT family glycosyltransferase [Candidatus Promineifilaceae bacterium]
MSARKFLPIVLILLLAFGLRTYKLTEVPPGLTHDEANHGWDSMNILDGVLLFYFPLNYGSEPLYNYIVAGNMALMGENLLSLRLVNGFFGLLTIAATFLWAWRAFDRRTAFLVAALLAISFWPVATSRQALRAGILPFLTTGAVIAFWQIVRGRRPLLWLVLAFGFLVALTLHTYLAARVLWLIFPLFILYLAVAHRPLAGRAWLPTLAGLALAGLLVIPMFAYVNAHPEAETRLQMLDGPLQNLAQGRLAPVARNAGEALLAFVWPGFGDHFLAYNIPGRPVLDFLTAAFFVAGLIVSLWRWRRPAYAFLLIWFGVGILPSLITGPTANTTRNLGAMPAVYLLPAVGFVALAGWSLARWGQRLRPAVVGLLAIWLLWAGATTVRDYFMRWAQSPDVRAAYQHTLVKALAYEEQQPAGGPVVVSSVYPGPAHDPSIARVLMPEDSEGLRWVDARYALIFPGDGSARLLLPASTPLHPAFDGLTRQIDLISLRTDDLDPSFSVQALEPATWPWASEQVNFGNAVTLVGARWLADSVSPGDTAELLTIWQVNDPGRVASAAPPLFLTEAVLFTHVLDDRGDILTQRDSLDAPSWDWQRGDVVLQVHQLIVPPETPAGRYETTVGIYDRRSGDRLPVLDAGGQIVDTRAFVVPLEVDG